MTPEAVARLGVFLLVFGAIAAWELAVPRRRPLYRRRARWPHNLALLALDALAVRMLAPGAVIGAALLAAERGWGLLNFVSLPPWASLFLALVLLDLAIYFQHVLFHAVPVLWRLHRVHHADQDFDCTTGIRFHPIEILLSLVIKCGAVGAIGASPLAVLIFEVLLNATAVFNHANASLPPGVERRVRRVLVTPDMHRVHHSIRYDESSTNFGFNLAWWDRLFGTYRAQPAADHAGMTIGVDAFRSARDLRLDHLLLQPFQDTPGQYPINGRKAAES